MAAGDASVAGSGMGGEGGTPIFEPAANYEVTGTWPERPVVVQTKPGQLKFTKLVMPAASSSRREAGNRFDGIGEQACAFLGRMDVTSGSFALDGVGNQ
jgi:hypothetical protein